MELTRHQDADAFLEHAGAFLAAREAENNLILGLSLAFEPMPLLYGEPAYFAVRRGRGRGGRSRPAHAAHNLVLSEIDERRGDRAVDA